VYGEVYLWGKVIVCRGGFRAQFAYPKSLFVTLWQARTVEPAPIRALSHYGVPIEVLGWPGSQSWLDRNSRGRIDKEKASAIICEQIPRLRNGTQRLKRHASKEEWHSANAELFNLTIALREAQEGMTVLIEEAGPDGRGD